MRTEYRVSRPSRRLTLTVLTVACLAACNIALLPIETNAGTLEIPAWAFTRGNVEIHTDTADLADAGPLVVSGPEQPWGWRVEYEVDIPVEGKYAIEVRYAAGEARAVEMFFDNRNYGKTCTKVTSRPVAAGEAPQTTWKSSGARWDLMGNQFGGPLMVSLTKGKHTLMFIRRGPLPNLMAFRLTTEQEFPEDWQPTQYKPRDIESIPAAHRAAFDSPKNVDVAAMRESVKIAGRHRAPGSLEIPAWSFDRGNAEIDADPDKNGGAGPVVGGGPESGEEVSAEYDIDFPVTGEYTLTVRYASAYARPLNVLLDGKNLGEACAGVTFGSAPFEKPVRLSADSWEAQKNREIFSKDGEPIKLSVTEGKHTLKFARRGPLPNLLDIRLDSDTPFPKEWKKPQRKMRHMDRVPAVQRAAFLPPDAVNVATLRLAIEDTMAEFGSKYADGPQYLSRLAELEKKQKAVEDGTPEDQLAVEGELQKLRSQVMLAHPLRDFDKILFLTRNGRYGHTYTDQHSTGTEGNLCILSPAGPEGKVTSLVPELEGGLFDRFDLSYDGTKVVFGHKKGEKGTFRLYEIEIDPAAGKMVPGSLRQLTFGGKCEDEVVKSCGWQRRGADRGFDDMDPVYLPDGKILFASTRSMRNTFCGGSSVTNLYVMDGDGKNMRCLSAGPINETAPAVMDDGRVIYTRWEYVDKGLGNGEGLWAVRPDGSGVDHVYKNNTIRPAGMSGARSIPGSRLFVTVGGTHHNTAMGPVVLVDTRKTRRHTTAMKCITPEIGYPCMGHPIRNFGFFMDPYPFSEKFFLVSHISGKKPIHFSHMGHALKRTQYGIYLLDAWGNRTILCDDEKLNCYQPMPLRPRRKPAELAPVYRPGKQLASKAPGEPAVAPVGTLFVQDVYEGLVGIKRGRVKYLRVVGPLAQPWGGSHMNQIGMNVDVHRKRIYGVVNVHEDGSAYFKVPANENILVQALDENYMTLQHMATFVNLMPGEQRSCIGCHEHRRNAPGARSARPMAMTAPPQDIVPQPGDTGIRDVDYAADVQPILDRRCVSCHGQDKPKAGLDLTGEPTARWCRSYENIIGKELIAYMNCLYGRSGYRAVTPLTHFSPKSKLVEHIRNRETCNAEITPEEVIKIITWVDANAPYYGTYRGKINLQDKDHPEFRALPLAGN